jgi:glycosyltransferase involved in cell wall biosynthesis
MYFSEIVPRSALVVVDSLATGAKLEKYYGLSPSRVVVLGLIPQQPQPSSRSEIIPIKPYIIYPAQKWIHKNHIVLFKALNLLKGKGIELNLVLTGSDRGFGPYLARLITEMDLDTNVIDMGFIDQSDVELLISRSVALVMPSKLGPTNLPPLEAIALGVPAIVSDAHDYDQNFGQWMTTCNSDAPEEWAKEIQIALSRTRPSKTHDYDLNEERERLMSLIKKLFAINERLGH